MEPMFGQILSPKETVFLNLKQFEIINILYN